MVGRIHNRAHSSRALSFGVTTYRRQAIMVTSQAARPLVTLRDRQGAMAAVSRGPVHWRKWVQRALCRLRSVVSVQVAPPERRARFLIIRRSWVRAPPAPPGGLHVSEIMRRCATLP